MNHYDFNSNEALSSYEPLLPTITSDQTVIEGALCEFDELDYAEVANLLDGDYEDGNEDEEDDCYGDDDDNEDNDDDGGDGEDTLQNTGNTSEEEHSKMGSNCTAATEEVAIKSENISAVAAKTTARKTPAARKNSTRKSTAAVGTVKSESSAVRYSSSAAATAAAAAAASKKRKYNPDAELIAQATDATLQTMDVDPNSKEGKRRRRQIRNRLSAQFHRDRKNAHIDELEATIAAKDALIQQLRVQLLELQSENRRLKTSQQNTPTSLLDTFQQMFPQLTNYSRLSQLQPQLLPQQQQQQQQQQLLYEAQAVTDSEDAHSISSNSNNSRHRHNSEQLLPTLFEYSSFSNSNSSYVSSSNSSTGSASPSDSPFHSSSNSSGSSLSGVDNQSRLLNGASINNSGSSGSSSHGVGLSLPAGFTRPLTFMSMLCMISIMLITQQQQMQQQLKPGSSFTGLMHPAIVDFLSKQFHSMNIQQQSPARSLTTADFLVDSEPLFSIDPKKHSTAAVATAATVEVPEVSITHGRRLQSAAAAAIDDDEAAVADESMDVDNEDDDDVVTLAAAASAVMPTRALQLHTSTENRIDSPEVAVAGAVVIAKPRGNNIKQQQQQQQQLTKSMKRVIGFESSHFLLTYTNETSRLAVATTAATDERRKGRQSFLRGGNATTAASATTMNSFAKQLQQLQQQHQLMQRKLVLSGGLVSHSMVDSAFLSAGTSLTAYYPHSQRLSHSPFATTAAPAAAAEEEEEGDGDEGEEGHDSHVPWQPSFAAGSYSAMIMTEGKVLLDPTLQLGRHSATTTAATTATAVDAITAANTRAVVANAGHHITSMRSARHKTTASTTTASTTMTSNAATINDGDDGQVQNFALMQAHYLNDKLPQRARHHDAESNKAVVASSTALAPTAAISSVLSQTLYSPATTAAATTTTASASIGSAAGDLIGGANVLTIKLPASSIRLGSSWHNSEDGTVEHIMKAFNISSPPQQTEYSSSSDSSSNGYYSSAAADAHSMLQNYSVDDAAVEINCIILGAKLVLSDPTVPSHSP